MVFWEGCRVLQAGALAAGFGLELEENIVRATIDVLCCFLALHSWLDMKSVGVEIGAEGLTESIGVHSCSNVRENQNKITQETQLFFSKRYCMLRHGLNLDVSKKGGHEFKRRQYQDGMISYDMQYMFLSIYLERVQ